MGVRRRLSAAKHWLGPPQNSRSPVLNTDALLRYKDTLQPLFPPAYFHRLEHGATQVPEAERRRARFVLQHSLAVPVATVANLHVRPGDAHFPAWLFVSAYLPVVAACMAPVGNLVSFVALLEHWQTDAATQQPVADAAAQHALNVAAFVLGVVANAALLWNFAGQARYMAAQSVLVACLAAAVACLAAAVALANRRIDALALARSEGFWLAVFTVAMYVACVAVLVLNMAGCVMHKYRARFNLDARQRRLMWHTISFCVWQAVGTVVMARLIAGLSYGASLYYCTVSILTIGLGDIVPETAGAKVYALFFSLVGVLIMGLIVAMLRQVVLSAAAPSVFWHRIERRRRAMLAAHAAGLPPPDAPAAFASMRAMRSRVAASQKRHGLAATLAVFVLFWLLGAAVFRACEHWSYFNAMYFCFLCLLTIGYGDFHPQTPFGRAFFVVWAIAAVPLMTILISNVGDSLFALSDTLDSVGARLFDAAAYRRLLRRPPRLPADRAKPPRMELDLLPVPLDPALPGDACGAPKGGAADPCLDEQMALTLDIARLLTLLRLVVADKLSEPEKEYDLPDWEEHMAHLGIGPSDDTGFWLGERSPLRLPLQETNYLLLKLLVKLDNDIHRLMAAQNKVAAPGDAATAREKPSPLHQNVPWDSPWDSL
ncbi:hypothetical protein METBIDRAFT_77758 [Metschnikowia bicuspidata var. bicuspidata NRRL YB-4993]|uniref:Potassium channel domain-containing protein n=1 Tax=Metschnikowia bicuspidata var. bicuspidata NRRL YB-4993 TaxID=869754 RepID=A0A1A0HEI9_9ASCO|nr:hypothetical protein METBIDRAFT_77758 [Metschnikowia bicuspidata var. bicuspidata NRRL YB-4993]OBA22317.1 hypothetical protein METBIDRAFT_77758 [Metschnikowia bicuspidata var. bicuspidata NRRL YB-4993]